MEKAVELHAVGQKSVRWVGVFVNPTPESIARTLERVPLDFIQLHGDEEVEDYLDYIGPPIIKALPWRGDEDAPQVTSWKSKLPGRAFRGFLVDAYDPVQRGGTGKRVNWSLLQPRPQCFQEVSLILAGGLNPETVAEAISVVRPDGLDVASGIEESPGVKSLEKMKRFMEIVKSVGFP